MTLNDKDIFHLPTASSGVRVGNLEYDYALAAQWWGFGSLEEFQMLDDVIQAHNVAVWRTKAQIDAVLAYKNRPKKKGKKG